LEHENLRDFQCPPKRILVSDGDGGNAGVSPLPHLAYPQASWCLLVSNPPEARHIQLRRVERIAT
jgi:hypothetical protein